MSIVPLLQVLNLYIHLRPDWKCPGKWRNQRAAATTLYSFSNTIPLFKNFFFLFSYLINKSIKGRRRENVFDKILLKVMVSEMDLTERRFIR